MIYVCTEKTKKRQHNVSLKKCTDSRQKKNKAAMNSHHNPCVRALVVLLDLVHRNQLDGLGGRLGGSGGGGSGNRLGGIVLSLAHG